MRLPALVLLPLVAAAAEPSVEIQSALDLAGSAPPEVAADALIRLAGLDRLAKPRRLELLDQAFNLAPFAPQQYKRRSALVRPIGPSGFLNRVYEQDLDSLSLQLRVVESLLPLAPQKARERFMEIAPLRLPQLTCADFLVFDVDRFYDVLGRVASQTFSPKEVRGGEPAKFVAGYMTTISFAAQVAPVARLVQSVAVKDAEFQSLVTAFAGALPRISADDRSFFYAASEAGRQIEQLATLSRRRQVSPLVVLEAYRQFLTSHLARPRCADDTRDIWTGSAANIVPFFNEKLAILPLQPIDPSSITAAAADGEAKGLELCEDAECRAVRDQYRALIFSENGAAFQPREREQPEWQAKARDFLGAMAAWTQSSGATPTEFFREKIGIFRELLFVAPEGPGREWVLRTMLEFLVQNRLPTENRLEWLLPVSQLAAFAGQDPLGWARMIDDLRRANDTVVALSIAVEALAPRSLDTVMPLL